MSRPDEYDLPNITTPVGRGLYLARKSSRVMVWLSIIAAFLAALVFIYAWSEGIVLGVVPFFICLALIVWPIFKLIDLIY